ncbi:MAG: xylulokinase [Clostridiaceae bacterium]|nr:xylulokinase [Clostridiaceae bacterium]
MKYLLGIDLGTSGTKTVLFTQEGKAVASATEEYPMIQPQNGWAEQHPDDWWKATQNTVSDVLKQSGIDPGDIAGIGISGQMHGLVILDKAGKVLRPAILWCDGRTTEECKEITETIGKKRLIEINANPALPGFTAGKILWVRKHEPEIWAQCAQIMLPKDYVRYKLTGVYATEVSDASGTNLMDVANRRWSDEIIEKLNIDRSILPKMYESADVTGFVTDEAAKATGLKAGTLVVGGAGDNAAAAVGTGVVTEGKAFVSIGTSGVIFAHSDKVTIDPEGRVHTFCAAAPGAWTVMSCTLASGLSLKWFRDNFCEAEIQKAKEQNVDPYYLMDKEAEKIPIGANRLIYLPYLMGERSPILDENSRGVFFGLSAIHGKYDMLRAVMEGVIYSQRNCLDVLHEMNVYPEEIIATGGGGSSPLWRQMIADTFGFTVKTSTNKEGPVLGVALLAGVGAGLYKSVAEACEMVVKTNPPQQPNMDNNKKYNNVYEVYIGLYGQLKQSFSKLSEL